MRKIALGSAIVGFAIVALAVAYRVELAESLLRHALVRAGFPDPTFAIERFDSNALIIRGLRAGETLAADVIEIDFGFRRLPDLPVDRLRVTGGHIDLTRMAAASGDTARSSARTELPLALLPRLDVDDLRAVIPSAAGPLTVALRARGASNTSTIDGTLESSISKATFHAETRLAPGAAVSIAVRIASLGIRGPSLHADGTAAAEFDVQTSGFGIRSAKGRIEASLADVAAAGSDLGRIAGTIPFGVADHGGEWSLSIAGGELRFGRHQVEASGISAEASRKSIAADVARLTDTGAEKRFEPMSLRFRWLDGEPQSTLDADVRLAGGRVTLHGSGGYDAAARRAHVDLRLPRTELDPGRLRLAELSPLLASTAARGGVEAAATIDWTPGRDTQASARVVVDDLSLDSPRARVDGLAGTIELARIFPPTTAGAQTLRAREIHPGVSFTDASLRWMLEPTGDERGSRLHVERLEAGLADGRLIVDDAAVDPSSAANRIDFRVENADVARIFEIAGLADTTGTGRLSGVIPVVVRAGAVAIPKGKLEAKGGLLRMQSQQAASVLAGAGQSATLLLDVLRDFHYDDLVVTIDKSFAGDASVTVHLEGNNPAVMAGQPFRINLNVSGNLDRLVTSLAEVARLSDRAVRATVGGIRGRVDDR